MTISEAKRESRLVLWQQHIHERQSSGLSIRAWCEQKGCSETSYYYWLKLVRERILAQAKGAALVEVKPEKLASAETACDEIPAGIGIYLGNVRVELPGSTSIETVAALVKALNHHD